MIEKIIKKILRAFGVEISRYIPGVEGLPCQSLQPRNGKEGSVLLAYILEPFLLKEGELVSTEHTHHGESIEIAKAFLDLGYKVDVIDYRDTKFTPQKEYAVFVSARTNFTRIAELLNKDCVKIVHLDTSHWLFNNYSAYKRCLALQSRRNIALRSVKYVKPNWAIESADYATILGNHITTRTYQYAKKPIFQVPVPACSVYTWPEEKDYERCRNHFLWFGSEGFVHKGLDLVLEAFSDLPDYRLTVCGPIEKEKDFKEAFHTELYETPNIYTVGWVDVATSDFTEIANDCVALIYPSCAEGQSGAVVTCLQAGLIPIISYRSGVDVHDFGIILKDCSISEIKNSIRMISSLPAEELRRMSRMAWEVARANHTRERFAEEYRRIVKKITAIHHEKQKVL